MKLMGQVRQSPPILTAGGFFEINHQLIPIVSNFSCSITHNLMLLNLIILSAVNRYNNYVQPNSVELLTQQQPSATYIRHG